ncbi:MAG: PIG-L family deacetylase [Deltaproteobacteria bacterium]
MLPYPTDLFMNGSVDGTVNFPALAVTPNGAAVNTLDGFGVSSEITVRFSMPIDATTLATPGAFLARYTLALPAALLAWVIAASQPWSPRSRRGIDIALVALAAIGLARAIPAFTDDGPSLLAVQRMSPAARGGVASIDLMGREWASALARVAPGGAVGFEGAFELSGLLWRGDGRTRVVFRERPARDVAELNAWVARERIEAAVLCDNASGPVARDHAERFEPLFRCRFEPCTVYRVRPAGAVATSDVRVLVVAPHPDDEVLIAAGVIRRSLDRGDRVDVVIMTNGDYTCARDGYAREAESVAALGRLGLAEDHVHFLGYPDGHLSHLGAVALGPVERRDAAGACVRSSGTYGARGEHRHDEHRARTGEPGAYSAASLTDDLAAIVARVRPTDVYVTHAIDDHPDHASTYAYLRRALERARVDSPVTVHRAVVHAGPCWPNGSGRSEPCPPVVLDPRAPMPPLPDPLSAYAPRERLLLPASMLGDAGKFFAISAYVSQTGPDPARDWLASFARADEVFYPERLALDAARGRFDRVASEGRAPGEVRDEGAWQGGATRVRSLVQRAPMECAFTVGAGEWVVRLLADGPDSGAADEIASDGASAVRISVRGDTGDARVLRRAGLPADAPGETHRYEVRLDPRGDDGGVVEFTVRRDGDVIAVAVDPLGRTTGRWIAATGVLAAGDVTCGALR